MASPLSLLLTFSLLLSLSAAIPPETITKAAEILSDAGFTAMSLTLPLISAALPSLSAAPSATIFSPSDESFSDLSLSSGQPSLSLLQFHISPRFYSSADLQSLQFGTQIPTLLPNRSLTATASVFDDEASINGVKLDPSPVFNDGFLAIYRIERFLNPNFRLTFTGTTTSSALTPSSTPIHLGCAATAGGGAGARSYGGASAALRSRGYSTMAAFLDLQLSQFFNNGGKFGVNRITVFAPSDSAMEIHVGNFSDWPWGSETVSLFLRHVVPCELNWADLVGLDVDSVDGANVLSTFMDGFMINVTHSGVILVLNGKTSVDFD